MYTVYSIVNTKTGDSYIGSTGAFSKRMSCHMTRAKKHTAPLYLNIRQFGLQNFIVNKLIEFTQEKDARAHEAELIEDLQPSLNVQGR